MLLVSDHEFLIRDPLVNPELLLLLWETFNLFLHVPKILFKCRIQFNGEIRRLMMRPLFLLEQLVLLKV